jgi:hypothetical protein
MNRYRVTMTVYEATSFDREIDAANEAAARQFAKQSVERDYPNASEILVDEVELLTAEPAPQPDPLALARGIIAGLLDAANLGVTELDDLSQDAISDEGSDETPALRADYDRRSTEAWAAIEAARAFLAKEPTT